MSDHATESGANESNRWSRFWPVLLGLLIAFGIAVRILKAWAIRCSPDSDAGIVELMAKHMVEGRDFPIFFYGQPYMGSLEPAISAFLCRLFGTSVFVVTLGTALVGALALPLVYLWGRDAGGRRVGLLAMLYCLVGSDEFFRYSVVARGGYMTMLVCGLTSLWVAIRIAIGSSQGRQIPVLSYLVLGLMAGLGWWSNQLILPFLLAAGCVLLLAWSRQLFRVGLPVAGLAFLIGCLPWWGWNLVHQWASIGYFGASLKHGSFATGLHNAWLAFRGIADLPSSTWWGQLRAVLLCTTTAGFVALLVRDRRCGENPERFFGRMAAVFVSLFMVVLYARSDYGDPPESRYLMPLIPAVAIMIGVSIDWLLRRLWFPVGVALLAFLIPNHIHELHRMFTNSTAYQAYWDTVRREMPQIAQLSDGACFAGWEKNWLNFAVEEKVTFSSSPKNRYAPYAVQVELAKNPAFLEDFRRVNTFLSYSGSGGQRTTLAGMKVTYGLTPPPQNWTYVNPSLIVDVRDAMGVECRAVLTDEVMDTRWSGMIEVTNPAVLTFSFSRPLDLCGFRLFSPNDKGPHRIQVEGQAAKDGEWTTLLPRLAPTVFFWSGPYIQSDGVQAYQEFRFSTPSGGVSRVRLTMSTDESRYALHLGEILFLQPSAPPDGSYPAVEACEAEIRRQGVRQFYGPRWVAELVSIRMGDEIETLAPSLLKCKVQDPEPGYDPRSPYPLVFREKTGVLIEARDLPRNRRILGNLHLQWEETSLGLYTLLAVPKPAPDHDSARYPTLCWTEIGCFAKDPGLYRKQKAHDLFLRATESDPSSDRTARIEWLEEALRLYPQHQPARRALASTLDALGRHEEASAQMATWKTQTIPETPTQIRFANGVRLLGITLSMPRIEMGREFEIVYFWKCPPTVPMPAPDVFVHFVKKDECFQDDHGLLASVRPDHVRYQPFDETFTECRRVLVPVSVSPGEYKIRIGLHDRNRRLRLETDLKQKAQAVELPVTIVVTPSS